MHFPEVSGLAGNYSEHCVHDQARVVLLDDDLKQKEGCYYAASRGREIADGPINWQRVEPLIVPRWWRPPPPGRSKNRDQGHCKGVPDSSTIISCSTIIHK